MKARLFSFKKICITWSLKALTIFFLYLALEKLTIYKASLRPSLVDEILNNSGDKVSTSFSFSTSIKVPNDLDSTY